MLSPLLFDFHAEVRIKETPEETGTGGKVGEHMVRAMHLADDRAMVEDTEHRLQNAMDR